MSATESFEPLLSDIETRLDEAGPNENNLQTILDQVLTHFDCVVGTIHVFNSEAGLLQLRAQRGIPEAILSHVQMIPLGKGMAGLAAERRAPVQVCNLQTDDSGVAKPGAKETQMEGSIAVPMLVGEALRGVLGIATPAAYEFSEAQTNLLLQIGRLIGKHLR